MKHYLTAASLIFALLFPFVIRSEAIARSDLIAQSPTGMVEEREETENMEAPEPAADSDERREKVIYALPYPGILPDHPLYPLKVLRDRILEFLIRDQNKKAEFYLLMADKRLNMGIFLEDKAKPELAETTVSKGEKYFRKGVELLEKMSQNSGREIASELLNSYETAALKHEEVIISLQKNAPENLHPGYQSSLKLAREHQEKLEQIGE